MAPIKFDDNIKEKLEKRVLTPSPTAWDSLSERLDNAEKGNNKRNLWWMGMAASIVGIILVVTIMLNQSDEQLTPTLVDVETPPISEDSTTKDVMKTLMEIPTEKASKAEVIQTETRSPSVDDVEVVDEPKTNNKVTKDPLIKAFNVHVVASIEEQNTKEEALNSIQNLDAESLKVMEVVAEIKSMTDSGYQVSEEELHQLLKQAEQELLKDKLYNDTTKMVDAEALLQDVEEDLEHSFRAKVFDALKNGFDSVRNAVANRNN